MNWQWRGNGQSNSGANTTLASDSSPFLERYEMDEDGDILGEVSTVHNSYGNYRVLIPSFVNVQTAQLERSVQSRSSEVKMRRCSFMQKRSTK